MQALVLAEEDPGVRISFGLAQFALGRYTDASRCMQRAACGPPILDPASIDLRRAYGPAGGFEEQLSRLERHVAEHAEDADAVFLLGFIKAATNEPAAGAELLRRFASMSRVDPMLAPYIERVCGPSGAR